MANKREKPNGGKKYSPDEIKRILELNAEGWTYKQIAEKVRPGIAQAWRSVGEIVRKSRTGLSPAETGQVASASSSMQDRVAPRKGITSRVVMPPEMSSSMTAHEFFSMLDDEQRHIFVSTYEDLRGEADQEQLTRAENEMLIRASFSNVKYLRAQQMLSLCESYLMMDLNGELTNSDQDMSKKRLAGRGDAYKKEAEQWHKEYMELLNDLKLTRKQRLDKIKDNRNTFLDLQQELMSRARQSSIVEEIKRINSATRDEFIRMARGENGPDGQPHPWLIGAFDDMVDFDGSQEVSD